MTQARHIIVDMSTASEERIPVVTLGWRLKLSLGEGSAQDMADYLGVSRQTLSRWMADKGAAPKRAYLMQWAMKTGVPIDWLELGIEPGYDGGGGSDGSGDGDSTLVRSYRPLAPAA